MITATCRGSKVVKRATDAPTIVGRNNECECSRILSLQGNSNLFHVRGICDSCGTCFLKKHSRSVYSLLEDTIWADKHAWVADAFDRGGCLQGTAPKRLAPYTKWDLECVEECDDIRVTGAIAIVLMAVVVKKAVFHQSPGWKRNGLLEEAFSIESFIGDFVQQTKASVLFLSGFRGQKWKYDNLPVVCNRILKPSIQVV